MEQANCPQYSFAMLLDPAAVQAAAERAAKWDLPRRICRPLDRRTLVAVSADVAAYDAAVENTVVEEA